MAGPDERFRKLRPAAPPEKRPQRPGPTADLFEHFGVDIGVREPDEPVAPAVEAAQCHQCGWFVPYRRRDPACPLCHEPDPIRPSAGGGSK